MYGQTLILDPIPGFVIYIYSTEKMGVANINDENILQSFTVQICWDHTIDSYPVLCS